jgi:septum site-determining protein MinC
MPKKGDHSSVQLKGVGENIWVTVDPSQPLDTLKSDLGRAFEKLGRVASNARVILDPGKEEGQEGLIEPLALFLKDNFRVGSVSGPAQKRIITEELLRQQDVVQGWRNRRSEALILSGRVRSGQSVTARKHLVLLGDVNPGGEVVAGGDILIMGSLCGTAAAGQPNHQEAIVLALDFRPIQVQICGVIATGLSSAGEGQAEFARLEGGEIRIEAYLKASPFGRLSWPQVR